MDFSNQYLTCAEYQRLGGTLSQNAFNLLEYKAQMVIDKYTFGRIKDLTTIPQQVKICDYDLIIKINSYSTYNTLDKSISSESSDGYSISHTIPTTELEKARNSELEGIVNDDLAEVYVTINYEEIPVLYRGVD